MAGASMVRRGAVIRAALCLSGLLLGAVALTAEGAEPLVVAPSPHNEANPVRFPDGTLRIYYMTPSSHIASIASTDDGLTWNPAQVEFAVSGTTANAVRTLLDDAGDLHLWYLQRGEANPAYPGDRNLDVWHNQMVDGQWAQPDVTWEGYVGALRGSVQTSNGRIVLPFAAWKDGTEGLPAGTGSNYTAAIYSDDDGASWSESPAQLTSPVFPNYNGNNYGAIEPGITELSDDRLWMLMRTQTDVLYESYSHDGGEKWSDAGPTRFDSSNSPATFLKLDDGRLVLFWNNAAMPPRVNGQGVYGGRDALHAAISDDDGQTWRGFREVYLDPTRHESPPLSGDRGTAYSNATTTADGHVLLVTGQGDRARAILRFHPDFLYETERSDDFANGLGQWSAFTEFGPASNFWRDRRQGPRIFESSVAEDGKVLHLRRTDSSMPGDGAAWNFAAGAQGTLTMRLLLNGGFDGASIGLVDRFFNPTDDAGELESMFRILINGEGRLGGTNATLERNTWYDLAIQWDLEAATANVLLDGAHVGNVALRNPTANGISYLCLRDTAAATSTGFFVDRVHVSVTAIPEPATLALMIMTGLGLLTRRRKRWEYRV